MFGGKKKRRWCNRCRRPAKQCICRPCPTCQGMAPAWLQERARQAEQAPLRIEHLQPLVTTQPVERPEFSVRTENVLTSGQLHEPAPKDAPLDDWAEFEDTWQEGNLDEYTDA